MHRDMNMGYLLDVITKENILHALERKAMSNVSFPPKMYSGGIRRERKQLWRKTIAELSYKAESRSRTQIALNDLP